jgi:endonuclease/exonuclease/phosphatase family metal-dependent hydrolase
MLTACQASCDDLKKIKSMIDERLNDDSYDGIPIIITGDFNSMSHRDYVSHARDQYEAVVDWPASHVLSDAGFRDAWRDLHPEVDRAKDRTWTPRFPEQEQDRIDFIYYRGEAALLASEAQIIDDHQTKFPSDHAALITQFKWLPKRSKDKLLRIASYNIRHGHGTDGKQNLERTAGLLNNLDADIVGLQEVDCRVKRSGSIDQAKTLGEKTGMNSAFGSFMDYGDGQYGMAILSRFPILEKQTIKLPDGSEPRVAPACTVKLPNGKKILVVNVHFDWIQDDRKRFAQAKRLAEFLRKQTLPYVLVGDFNDTRESRTLKLLSKNLLSAEKIRADRYTYSSTEPKSEIDFIFAADIDSWKLHNYQVLDATRTSDHRPILAVLEFKDTTPLSHPMPRSSNHVEPAQ